MIPDVVKTILPAVTTFIVGILITPIISNFLYKKEMWKKRSVSLSIDGQPATISQSIHNDEVKKTPRMGGIVVWGSVLIAIILICLLGFLFENTLLSKLTFLSRNQTWLPFVTLICLSIFGLVDDYLVCKDKGDYKGGGLSLITRLLGVFLVACAGAWWFYSKLGYASIIIPFFGELQLGLLFIPLFIITMLAIYSGGIIDGVDGLAGGVFAILFTAYGAIAFYNSQFDLAAFSMAIVGGLLAFLWFNIPPARFFLSETGTMGLTATLVVIAFLTKAVAVLPLIALPLIITTLSTIIQIVSKKYRNGKKVFLVAPLHNHFQAIGWPAYKVTMRYWIVTSICAISGVIITLIG
jgi:phospho-N-acetylmuramoyl-pentapeptide-transferase